MNISVTVTQAQQGLDVMGTFTPEQRIRSSTRRELYGTAKLLQNFGPILNGVAVPIYLDSQVAVMLLGAHSVPLKISAI